MHYLSKSKMCTDQIRFNFTWNSIHDNKKKREKLKKHERFTKNEMHVRWMKQAKKRNEEWKKRICIVSSRWISKALEKNPKNVKHN